LAPRKHKIAIVLVFLVCLALVNKSFSQNIIGNVTDTENNSLSAVTVVLKSLDSSTLLLDYTITDDFGKYSLDIDPALKSFIVEFKSLGFTQKSIEIIDFPSQEKPLRINAVLTPSVSELQEVLIESTKKSITVKKDTTTYDPTKFMDGTERVVEDLIRKLPGMKVEDNGKITFKGKTVESLLLDGDDLFDANYTIGTKNIDVDMVEKLSAIENYIKNPLLHGIANTNSVAINLSLKKGKSDFSNTSTIGAGIENSVDINSSLLGISKKLKSFSTGSFNNVGKEYSPYDYFSSNSLSLENANEEDLTIARIINDGGFSSDISEERSRINNNFFGSINSIYNITHKFGAKINFDYKKDNLERNILSQTTYLAPLDSLNVIQNESLRKKPELFNIKLDLNYKLSDSELIESKSKLKNEDISTLYDIRLNNIPQKNATTSNLNQLKQVFNYTKRINSKSAFIGSLLFNNSTLSQNQNIEPDIRFSDFPDASVSNQAVDLEKTYINLSGFILNATEDYNLKLGVGYTFEKNNLFSLLTSENTNNAFAFNEFDYQNKYPWIESNFFFKVNKWGFRTQLDLKYLNQKLAYNKEFSENKKNSKFLFLPKVQITYNINKKSNFQLLGNYNEDTVNESYLFEDVIFTSNRNSLNNIASLETLKRYGLDLRFNHNDFFNLFQFYAGVNYLNNINNYLTSVTIDELLISNTRTLFDASFENASVNTGLDAYVNFIKSNVRLNFSYGVNSYKNVVNNSQIRDNLSYSGFSELNIKTGFLGFINFENNFQFQNAAFKTENLDRISNSSFQNSFKVFLRPNKKIRFITGFDYYLPNLNEAESFIFFDSALTITSKNGNIDYSIISKNLTPKENIFTRTDVSDFSTSTFSYNLVDPYLLFSINFKL